MLDRQSFERFCDDYAIDILQFLSFEDKIRLLHVSTQFYRCLPLRQHKLIFFHNKDGFGNTWTKLWRWGDWKPLMFDFKAFESILKTFKFLNHFEFNPGYKFYGLIEQELLLMITKYCNKIKYVKWDFRIMPSDYLKDFINKNYTTLKYINISTINQIELKYLMSANYYWQWNQKELCKDNKIIKTLHS
jgi:hypothetical protein